MTERQYLRAFDRVNLCAGAWSAREAASAAMRLKMEKRRVVVMLGAKVKRAFGFVGVLGPFDSITIDGTTYVAVPHPSGRCLAWNDPTAGLRARVLIALAIRAAAGVPTSDAI